MTLSAANGRSEDMRQPHRESQQEITSAIGDWWAQNPMTYAPVHGATTYALEDGTERSVELGSREFFEIADRTLYQWNESLHTPGGRFGRIFDYERYRGRPVLEIGCGMGCMAMNWAMHGARVTAVDLNPVAVAQTRRRFDLLGQAAVIQQADSRRLPFMDESF